MHQIPILNMVATSLIGGSLLLYGCAGPMDSPEPAAVASPLPAEPARPVDQEQRVTATPTRVDRNLVVAMVDGQALRWGDLRPALTDLGGAIALQEAILDRKIAAELDLADLKITSDDIAHERRVMLDALSEDPDQALRLLDELRTRQRLGAKRLGALLRRNAGLRALVREDVQVNDGAVQRLFEIVHGPKRQPRLLAVSTVTEAKEARRRIRGGEFFGDVAVEISTDSSAARGGLLPPVSRLDPSYPLALRQTLFALDTGQLSSPILIEGSYLLLQLEREIEADGTKLVDIRHDVERAVRLQQERVLMDEFARRLLSDASIVVLDKALDESWRRARRGQ